MSESYGTPTPPRESCIPCPFLPTLHLCILSRLPGTQREQAYEKTVILTDRIQGHANFHSCRMAKTRSKVPGTICHLLLHPVWLVEWDLTGHVARRDSTILKDQSSSLTRNGMTYIPKPKNCSEQTVPRSMTPFDSNW